MEKRRETLYERIGTLIMVGACVGGSANCYQIILHDLNPISLLIYLGLAFLGAALIVIATTSSQAKEHTMIRTVGFVCLTIACYIGMDYYLSDISSERSGYWIILMAMTTIGAGATFLSLCTILFGRGRTATEDR